MTRTTSIITTTVGGMLLLSLIGLGIAHGAGPGASPRTNTVSLNGLQLNGTRLDAITRGDAGSLVAEGGRLRPAAR